MRWGEFLTRGTIWISMLAYTIGCVVFATSRRWNGERWVRLAWTTGCVALLVHFVCAFHFYHAWSHAAAYVDTARQTAEILTVTEPAADRVRSGNVFSSTNRICSPGGRSPIMK